MSILAKKLKASSLAELVIALSIIALCISIAALVFIRSLKTNGAIQEIKEETDFQSSLYLYLNNNPDSLYNALPTIEKSNGADGIEIYTLWGTDHKLIWEQEILPYAP
jgi:hypothetical protein